MESSKPSFLRNIMVRVLLFGVLIIVVRFAYVITITVCCEDGRHCCPNNYPVCDTTRSLCLKKTGNFTAIKPFWKKDSSNKLGRFEEWVM